MTDGSSSSTSDKCGTTVIVDKTTHNGGDDLSVSTEATGGSDTTFHLSVSDSEKQINMAARPQRSIRGRETPADLINKTQLLAADNKAKISNFCDHHIEAMSKGNRRRHYVRALMACQVSARATVWQKVVSPFLYTCSVLEISVFDWMSSSLGIPRVYVPVNGLENNGWMIPKVANISPHMKQLRNQGYQIFLADYNEEKEEMERENLVDLIEENSIDPDLFKQEVLNKNPDKDGIDMRNGRCIRLAELPPAPPQTEINKCINLVRKWLWLLHHSWRDSELVDVRLEVLWFLSTLRNIVSLKEFEDAVEEKVREGMRHKMQQAGQTTLPDYYKSLTTEEGRNSSVCWFNGKKRKPRNTPAKGKPKKKKVQSDLSDGFNKQKTTSHESDSVTDEHLAVGSPPTSPSLDEKSSSEGDSNANVESDSNGSVDGDTPSTPPRDPRDTDTPSTPRRNPRRNHRRNHPTISVRVSFPGLRNQESISSGESVSGESDDKDNTVNQLSSSEESASVEESVDEQQEEELQDDEEKDLHDFIKEQYLSSGHCAGNGPGAVLVGIKEQQKKKATQAPPFPEKETPKMPPPDKTGNVKDIAGNSAFERLYKRLEDKLRNLNDGALSSMLKMWEHYCKISKQESSLQFAVRGIFTALAGMSIVDIYQRHHINQSDLKPQNDPTFSPPAPLEVAGKKIRWEMPHDNFVGMAEDTMNVLYIAIAATYTRRANPPRWTWETTLLDGMRRIGQVTRCIREVSMLVCLILSAATPDDKCIVATVALFEAGMLDLVNLSQVHLAELETLIKPTGIYEKRAVYLKEMATTVLNEHGGQIPACLKSLLRMKGVGRKTAVLMMNECFGLPEGIGTDVHVTEVSRALGFILEPKLVKCTVDHIEASLLTWNCMPEQQRMFNPITGSFAQLFTRQLKTITTDEEDYLARTVISAICSHITRSYEVELLWFSIAKCRIHYQERNFIGK